MHDIENDDFYYYDSEEEAFYYYYTVLKDKTDITDAENKAQ